MEVTVLAAVDRRLAIGRDNDLPWRLPDDLARFKARTLGKALLMGRRTAESLGRALPGRRNLVLTRSGRVPFAGMEAVASLEDALAIVAGEAEGGRGELCVIGGAEVYALALPHASSLHLTRVDTVVADADAFFPVFDEAGWRVISRERHPADGRHAFAFEFVDYRRP
ncbi:dihydrofolate reductase [Luteimonas terricola]|uniref:dihydrofolate reductase n=1 Tax=Luteimonas terricola TaxID=645597 RepID=UPI0010428F68|nr:dihydrofolate reductase [Luteimonas terricola]